MWKFYEVQISVSVVKRSLESSCAHLLTCCLQRLSRYNSTAEPRWQYLPRGPLEKRSDRGPWPSTAANIIASWREDPPPSLTQSRVWEPTQASGPQLPRRRAGRGHVHTNTKTATASHSPLTGHCAVFQKLPDVKYYKRMKASCLPLRHWRDLPKKYF